MHNLLMESAIDQLLEWSKFNCIDTQEVLLMLLPLHSQAVYD